MAKARLWKLNASTVLALVDTGLVVYKIDAFDDISQAAATLPAFHSTYVWGTEAASLGLGQNLLGQYISDNVVWFVQRVSGTSAINLIQVVYNPATDTLTKTTLATLQASTTATHFWRYGIQKIPGTSNWFVYTHGGNTTVATSTLKSYHILNSAGTVLQSVTAGLPANGQVLVPLSASRILALTSPRTYTMSADGVSWSTPDATFAASMVASTEVLYAEALDQNYFIEVSMTSGTDPVSGSYSIRVSRYIDTILGQSSSATSTGNGIAYTNINPYFDQKQLLSVDDTNETFVILGRASATAFSIRVLYQAAV